MARPLRHRIRFGFLAVATGVGLAVFPEGSHAAPDWELVELREQLADLSDALRDDSPLRDQNLQYLLDGMDIPELSDLAIPAPAKTGPPEPGSIRWTDKRYALAAMSQIYGGSGNKLVLEAGRPGNHEAIEITSGDLTLSDLRDRLTARHLGRDPDTGASVLRVPLVIGRNAKLRLADGDKLYLSQSDGAFLVNFGRLEVVGGEISADHDHDLEAQEFSPFVVSVGSGTVRLSDATFRRLGFGYTAKFAGFSILSHPTMAPTDRNLIERSRFEDIVTVALVGIRHAEINGNRFFEMRRNPLLIAQSPDSLIQANLFSGDSPTNAVRVANGSSNSIVRRNVVLEGSRAGLLVTAGSDNVEISHNLIWRRNGGGVKLNNVRCGLVEENLILDDKQKGVEIRSSESSVVQDNRIIGNANAGVWVSANEPQNLTYVVGNLIRENGSGLSGASGGRIAMQKNDLRNQFPRFLDGDITWQFREIIDDLRGERPIILDSGGAREAHNLAPEDCDF